MNANPNPMKIIILASAFTLLALSACKKEITQAPNQPPPVVQSTQDPQLFGTWILDSLKTDGSATQLFADTLYISASKYSDNLWVGSMPVFVSVPNWHTSGDSLIAAYRSKYAISGVKLWQYVNNKPNPNDQRWYHKK